MMHSPSTHVYVRCHSGLGNMEVLVVQNSLIRLSELCSHGRVVDKIYYCKKCFLDMIDEFRRFRFRFHA